MEGFRAEQTSGWQDVQVSMPFFEQSSISVGSLSRCNPKKPTYTRLVYSLGVVARIDVQERSTF